MPPTGNGRQRLPTVKLLFDHNLAPGLVKRLGDIHQDSAHVTLLGLDERQMMLDARGPARQRPLVQARVSPCNNPGLRRKPCPNPAHNAKSN
jgi:hypothetical protein